MAEGAFDHVIAGSGPLPALVAGLLAAAHGRKVCLIAEPFSPFRLPRGVDLSLVPLARPETMLLLKRNVAETLALLGGLGKGLSERIDLLAIAETPATLAALSHFRHLALSLDHGVERLIDRSVSSGAIFRSRDVVLLSRPRLEPALAEWHARLGVTRLQPEETTLKLLRDGKVAIRSGGREWPADSAILADDAAILAQFGETALDKVLQPLPMRAMLTEPLRLPIAPLTLLPDRQLLLQQRGRAGVLALLEGDPETAAPRLGASLGGPARLAGLADFTALRSRDGAPFVGVGKPGRATLLAGFGPLGAFLAPAIARHIAGASPSDEAAWFAARGASGRGQRAGVAEYAGSGA